MRFKYLEPHSIEEALELLSQYGGQAKVLAGGTDLMVQIGAGVQKPRYLLDLEGVPELALLDYSPKDGLCMGPTTTIRRLETDPLVREHYPVLAYAAGQIGSVAIRNVGTVGGNICNASPSADSVPALMGLSAQVVLMGPVGRRTVDLADFFVGPGQTVLAPEELLVEIRLPPPGPNKRAAYLKHKIRDSLDLAIVSVAVVADFEGDRCHDLALVVGAAAPTVFRARQAEGLLRGQRLNQELIQAAAQKVAGEASPINDARGSAEYRRQVLEVLAQRALREVSLNGVG